MCLHTRGIQFSHLLLPAPAYPMDDTLQTNILAQRHDLRALHISTGTLSEKCPLITREDHAHNGREATKSQHRRVYATDRTALKRGRTTA